MKTSDLLTVGIVGIGAYLLMKTQSPAGALETLPANAAIMPDGSVVSTSPVYPLQTPEAITDVGLTPIGITPVGITPVQMPKDTPIELPLPVVLDVPSMVVSDYGGEMSPIVGPVFSGENAQGALDYANAGYISAIAPYMASGDIVNFLSLFFTIYDPDRNPLVYQQNIGTPEGKAVYDYYDAIMSSLPSLTKEGVMAFFGVKDIQHLTSAADFMYWAGTGYKDPNANREQIESWFEDPSFLTAPLQSSEVTWQMAMGFLNHLGEPYVEGTDTYAYWQEMSGKWFRADLDKNVVEIGLPPWLLPVSPFSSPGGY
jgi:hypothetical protein